MPKDRLAELERIRDQAPLEEDTQEELGMGDGAVVIQMDKLDDMSRFFAQADEIRKLTQEVKDDVARVTRLQSNILSNPAWDEKSKTELDSVMSTIKTSLKIVRKKLKDVEAGIRKDEDGDDATAASANLRIRKTQHSTLLKGFTDVLQLYQNACSDYKDRCKTRIKRQIGIAGTEVTDDEVETMIENGNWSVFTNGILEQTEQARQMLADVQARHDDIIKLEKSIIELHEMFMEMSVLVESQGHMIDSIESQVGNTAEYVEEAQKQLKQAEKSQQSARKKKIWIILIVLIVVVVIGLIIGFT